MDEPTTRAAQPEVHLTDPASIAERGTYAARLATRLATASDANARAQAMLLRQAQPAWILEGVGIRLELLGALRELTPAEQEAETAALLELEVHDLITVTGLPAGSPYTSVTLWIEGWTETIAADGWHLELAVSDYCRSAAAPTWDDLSAETGPWGQGVVSWDTIADAMTWNDAACMPPPAPAGRWNDAPASLHWNEAGTTAWNDWS